jgi:hypothetical protein
MLLKFVTVSVEPFAVRIPPADVRVIVGAVMERLPMDVSRAVVLDASWIVSVPANLSPRVAIVNVWGVPAEDSNVTLLNSASERFAPANVIVPPTAESNTMVPVPASQTVASVEAFVHVPETVQVSEPKSMAEAADEIFTLPVMTTAPDVLVKSPPDKVRAAELTVNVPFASVPPLMVSVESTTILVAKVAVPALIVRLPKALSVPRRVIVAVASKVTVLVPWVKIDPAPEVSQFPETVHGPLVSVRVPEVPPVIVTLDTITVDAFAVSVPPLPIFSPGVSADAPSARSEVAKAVVDDASVIDRVESHRNPRVAMVNVCAVPALLVNVTLLNSASDKFDPAKVIVPPAAESNITVPVPASHDAEVVLLVQVPPKFQVPLPKSM